jgi:predicted dehydrogenase
VIGAGNIAEKHLEVLAAFDDVETVALSSSGHPRIHALAARFKIERTFTDYRLMLDTVQADTVLVLVSVVRIPEVAGECLRRGMPTLLEKPPGLSAADTKGLLEIAAETRCLNMVALNRRFYSVMRRAREAVLEAGPLVSVLVEAPEHLAPLKAAGFHPAEVVERFLFANGIHCIDLLRYFGGEVEEVYAMAGRWAADQKDSFNALLRFQSGATGHYVSNWTSPARWSVTLYGLDRRIVLCPLERGVLFERDGTEQLLAVDEADTLFKPGLFAQNRYFLDCLKEGRPISYPAADLADTLKTMELIEAIGGSNL